MKRADFEKYVQEFMDLAKKEMFAKSTEYSGVDNVFSNFYMEGAELDLPSEKIMWVYFKKHYRSIVSFMKHKKEFSREPIKMRFVDVVNYMILLSALFEWQKKTGEIQVAEEKTEVLLNVLK